MMPRTQRTKILPCDCEEVFDAVYEDFQMPSNENFECPKTFLKWSICVLLAKVILYVDTFQK